MKLHNQIFLGMVLGVLVGLFFQDIIFLIEPIGEIFIRLLRMIIVPLVVASIIMGVVSVGDVRSLGKLGGKTFVYYMCTTFLSVSIGLIVVNLLKPGEDAALTAASMGSLAEREIPTLLSILIGIIPKNPFEALATTDILSVIFFSLCFGAALTTIGKKGEGVIRFFDGLNDVMMTLTAWVMKLAPLGVFALMATVVAQMGLGAFKTLAMYMLAVIFGLTFHAMVVIPSILYFVGKCSPIQFLKGVLSALATAFSTSSSAATLPISINCLEKNIGVSNRTTSFVLPLGATINMDGTALYEAVAAIFIAQAYGIDLSTMQQVVVVLTATLASIGAAAIPGAGLITLAIVLNAVNLPLEGLGVILAVDRILDMCRTTVNVWGDTCGTAVIARLEGEKF